MTVDCPPQHGLPQKGALSLNAIMNRLDDVEAALAICRMRLQAIREMPLPADPSVAATPTTAVP